MKTGLGGFFTGLIMLLGVQSFAMAEDVNTHDPYLLIEQAANKTFARFRADKALIDADLNHLKVIVKEELMPYVDSKYAAYKVMGQYLRDTSVDQREHFVTAFEGYLVATYAQAFTQYTDQKVVYDPGTDFSKEKMVEVNVQIIEEGRPPIKILFKVRRLKDNSWKAFDLIAEGISLLASKQSEISNLIRKDGIDAVIVLLNEKTKEKIDRKAGDDAA
jgi:phospholipid transport system substrate-binding protein